MQTHLNLSDFIRLLVRSMSFSVSVLGEPYGPNGSDSSELSLVGAGPPPTAPNSSSRRGITADADEGPTETTGSADDKQILYTKL